MPRHSQPAWLPGLLFCLAVGASGVLLLLVVAAPVLAKADGASDDWSRLLAIFARDTTVRRTAVASALGLVVTACVFFKAPSNPWRSAQRGAKGPPPDVIGA